MPLFRDVFCRSRMIAYGEQCSNRLAMRNQHDHSFPVPGFVLNGAPMRTRSGTTPQIVVKPFPLPILRGCPRLSAWDNLFGIMNNANNGEAL